MILLFKIQQDERERDLFKIQQESRANGSAMVAEEVSLSAEEVEEHTREEEERRVKEAWAAVGDAGKEMKYSEEGRSWIRRAFGDWNTNKEVRAKRGDAIHIYMNG